MNEAILLSTNAVTADGHAATRLSTLRSDICWHETRVKDCSIANAATCWIPGVGLGITIGFTAAIADSTGKLPGLREEMERVSTHKTQNLEKAKKAACSWLAEMEMLKGAMSVKC